MHIQPLFFVYILKCADNTFYTGMTNDLIKRLNEHESGTFPGSYTYDRRPIQLVYFESFTDPETAFNYEQKIKKWSKAKKQALIDQHFNKLPLLSKKKF